MLFGPDNFLTVVKFLVTGGGRSAAGNPALDAGFSVVRPLSPPVDLRTAAGLVLTAATAPSVIVTETNGLTVVSAASGTALGSFTFQIPKDYDENTDELKLNFVAGMDGATDTPTVNATVYRKRAGVALSANLAPVASAALAQSSALKTIDISGKSMLAGDYLTINLVTGAHTTNNVSLHSLEVSYRSTLVSYQAQDSSGNDIR